MNLVVIPSTHVDKAWEDGARCLSEATDVSGGEITGDQLKTILSRGDRTLIQMQEEGITTGWGVVRIDQLPNMRVLQITDLVAHNARFERYFDALAEMAKSAGCSRIRCCAKPAQARLYQMKSGFTPVYTTLEKKL